MAATAEKNKTSKKITLHMGSLSGERVSQIAAGTMASTGVPAILTRDDSKQPGELTGAFNAAAKPDLLAAAINDLASYHEMLKQNSKIARLAAYGATLKETTQITREGLAQLKAQTDQLKQSIEASRIEAMTPPSVWKKIGRTAKAFIS